VYSVFVSSVDETIGISILDALNIAEQSLLQNPASLYGMGLKTHARQ
jgi:hypothetical protein